MAHRLGLDRSYISEIEAGKRNLCLLNLKVLADGLGISLAKLFSGLK
jgi:transcriptional regulator with XRE-family HTH domain